LLVGYVSIQICGWTRIVRSYPGGSLVIGATWIAVTELVHFF